MSSPYDQEGTKLVIHLRSGTISQAFTGEAELCEIVRRLAPNIDRLADAEWSVE